ncbi:23S rRNA (pseudouridine(1915)-N(3))-methyltransferase RlmH [Coxiella burnetii]|uniref:23S rRNA (pseudouridine(1915)-N(3))-methyltransferase RlmH n=1 Tax=Coxiella burnetii TaxID=777 RepID=UPI000BFC12F2|nr:23S rRNA (pseudouridine(1915)-N(3))-methyltransferase RlmH [Coxiella burnetii]PHH57126.1 23S rRNA (pseudouridine(1915)-N(3))-methyltransferase RlmH [Coxiella burnetii]
MKINVVAVGKRLPAWIKAGFQSYADRLPRDFDLNLIEIVAFKRSKGADLKKIMLQESQQLIDAVPKESEIIVLDRLGEEVDTPTLAQKLSQWRHENRSISLLIGGPEGLSATCIDKARWVWSLSALTLPHALARVIVAEQIYRAWSIITNHPYHR